MKKFFIREYDPTSVIINEFEGVPSEKNKIGRTRIAVTNEDNKLLLWFKIYNDGSIEILNKPLLVNDFDDKLNEALMKQLNILLIM